VARGEARGPLMMRELLWTAAATAGILLGFTGALAVVAACFAWLGRRQRCQWCGFRGTAAEVWAHEAERHLQ
jgi:hypothetical protein